VANPNGVMTKFFKVHWELIKGDYFQMINKAIDAKQLPFSVTKDLILLLCKEDAKNRLTTAQHNL